MIEENWDTRGVRTDARATEDESDEGLGLIGMNPWPTVFASLDEALYEDAKRSHFRKLIEGTANLANSWAEHVERCRSWVEQIANEIVAKSGMRPYGAACTPPYVMHYRLGVFAYRRLFQIRTGALHKTSQGQLWALEGAPGLPGMIGCSALATEQQLDVLTEEIDKIIASHRDNSERLREEAHRLERDLAALHGALQLAVASKRLRGRCDLVTFF